MTLNEKISYELITKNVLDVSALKTLGPNVSNVYRQLGRLLSAGYIREKSYTVKSGRRQKKIDYYSLTSYGFRFLAGELAGVIPWLEKLHADNAQEIRIIGGALKPSQIASRYIKVSAAALMADMAGANENTLFISIAMSGEEQLDNTAGEASTANTSTVPNESSQESADVPLDVIDFYSGLSIDLRDEYLQPQDDWYGDTARHRQATKNKPTCTQNEELYVDEADVASNSPSLAEVVTEEMSSYYRTGAHFESEISFVDAQTIKGKMEEVARQKDLTPPDLRGGRYSGLIGSPYRVAMMYCASELSPIKWRKNFKKREMVAYSGGRQLFFPGFTKDSDPNAVLLVSDEKAFAASYESGLSSAHTSGKHRGGDALKYGDGFSKFWVVPISFNGSNELHSIMTTSCEATPSEIVAKLIAEDKYMRNTGPLAGTFPLADKTCEAMVAVVPHLDVIWLEHINATMKRFPNNHYSLLCYAWQIPYVKVVITQDCDIRELKVIPGDITNRDYGLMLAVEKEAEFAKSRSQ